MIDNQLAAQLLYDHKLATREDILASWPFITADKDVGALLVERGLLPAQTYHQMMVYMQALSPGSQANPPGQAAAPSQPDSPHAAADDGAIQGAGNSRKHGRAKSHSHKNENVVEISLTDGPNPDPDPNMETWSPAPSENTTGPKASYPDAISRDSTITPRTGLNHPPTAKLPVIGNTPPHPTKPNSTEFGNTPLGSGISGSEAPGNPAMIAQRNPGVTSGGFGRGGSSGRVPTRVPDAIGPQSGWNELLAYARHNDASDLHLSAGNPILLRRYGALQTAGSTPMDQESMHRWAESALDVKQWEEFDAKGDLEIIYTLEGHGRYRVTLMKQRRGFDITARVIPARIRSFDELGLPESCRELSRWAQGLVLLTGPVGCGKSSTLSTLVDMVNQERHDHIITIEEPIEILYEPVNCRITQRQLGPHTLSRDAALRAALREDPDIIVISELRDLDTIRLAVSAAETGHLVFGTMNTTNAGRTIYRLIDSFPPEEQGIIRNMISESLRGVISQQLLARKDGQGMIPAFEVLLINSAVANLIRKDEAHQLGTAMITGKAAGMVLLDDSLRSLVERGLIDPYLAMTRANNPKDFERYVGRGGR